LQGFAPPLEDHSSATATNSGATLEFTTQPDPPRKGANKFRVHLKDVKGMPLAGVDVAVSFFMPAMPAMGMAEMKSETRLREIGNGDYEGAGSFQSGGTWQVTITARKNGQTISTRQLSLNAAGGM